LILCYNDTTEERNEPKNLRVWTLDLPGGKRHLGESSLQGAIRETYEEMTLVVDEEWVYDSGGGNTQGKNPNKKDNGRVPFRQSDSHSQQGNVYYMMRPPASLLMKEMQEDPFWQTDTTTTRS